MADTIRVYLDGEVDAYGWFGLPIVTGDHPFNIGGNYSSSGVTPPDGCFDGIIDEVSIYNAALSTSEIREIYTVGSRGKCK